MIRAILNWIGGIVMRLIDRGSPGVRRPDVKIDVEWEELKKRAERKPYE